MGWNIFKPATKEELRRELDQQLQRDAALQEQLSTLGKWEKDFRKNETMQARATQRLSNVRAGVFSKQATITAHQQLCDELAQENPALHMSMQKEVAGKVSQTYEKLELSDQTTLEDYKKDYGKLGIGSFDVSRLFKNQQERPERVSQLMELLNVVAIFELEEQEKGWLSAQTKEQLQTKIQNLKQEHDPVADRIPQDYFDNEENWGMEFLLENHSSLLVSALKNAVLGELYQEAAASMQQNRSSVDMDAFYDLMLESQKMNLLTQRIPASSAYTTDLDNYRNQKIEDRHAKEEFERQEQEKRWAAEEQNRRIRQRDKDGELKAIKKRKEEVRKAEEKRKEEVRKAEEKRIAEQARLAEEKRKEEERKAEEKRKEEERKKQEEEKRKEEERKAEEKRIAEEKARKEKEAREKEEKGCREIIQKLVPELKNLQAQMNKDDYKYLTRGMDAYLHGFSMNPETNEVFSVTQATQAMAEWLKRHGRNIFLINEETKELFDDPKAAESLLRHHYFVACEVFRYMALIDLYDELSKVNFGRMLDKKVIGSEELDALWAEIKQREKKLDAYATSEWGKKIKKIGKENKIKEANAKLKPWINSRNRESDEERALREQAGKFAEKEQLKRIEDIKKQVPYTEDPVEKLSTAYRRLAEFFGIGRIAKEVPDEKRGDDAKGGKYLTLEQLHALIKDEKIDGEKLTYAPEAMEQMVDIRDLDRLFGLRRSAAHYLVRLENDNTIAEVRVTGANQLFEARVGNAPWDSSLPMNRDFVTKLNNYRLGERGLNQLLLELMEQDQVESLLNNIQQAQESLHKDLPDIFRKEDYEDNFRLERITKRLKQKQPGLFGEQLTNEQLKGRIVHIRNRIQGNAPAEYKQKVVKPEDELSEDQLKRIRTDCAQADKVARICAEHMYKNETEKCARKKQAPLKPLEFCNRSKEPLFTHIPCPQDIKQGHVGDCYLLSALIAITKENPEKITDMMQDMGDLVRVKFQDKTVYVTKKICKPYSAYGDALWVQVMEKAFAQTLDDSEDVADKDFFSDDYPALQEQLLKGEEFQALSPEEKDAKFKELYAKTIFKAGEGGQESLALRYLLGYTRKSNAKNSVCIGYYPCVNGDAEQLKITRAITERLWNLVEQEEKEDPQWQITRNTLRTFFRYRLKRELEYRLGINTLDKEAKITKTEVDGEIVRTGKRKRSNFRPFTINDICEALTDITNWMDQDGHVVWAELLLELKKTAKQPDAITKDTLQQYMKRLSDNFMQAGEKQGEDRCDIQFRTQLDEEKVHYTPRALLWFKKIKAAVLAKNSIVCSASSLVEGKDANGLYKKFEMNGVVLDHSYQVTDAHEENGHKYITVTNPWGMGIAVYTQRTRLDGTSYTTLGGQMEETDDHGTFDMELNDFMNHFYDVSWEK